eukprot:CAMPEP_0204576004 /NCGR_PEP_ID=MMETSP0661-20131031/41520_1 /ASSEMBLY_ACC=CAM_ASM_000606 /TAXON_ID=109239 /ORGANISM="Alexandrium margalefi, Strain AMGDE01CS-322" /LENGTH=56 /DNA_ID=CAMNT_0051584699 /DNA_START=49 /DNA_END=215 /DNA_ORIENTATION=+
MPVENLEQLTALGNDATLPPDASRPWLRARIRALMPQTLLGDVRGPASTNSRTESA